MGPFVGDDRWADRLRQEDYVVPMPQNRRFVPKGLEIARWRAHIAPNARSEGRLGLLMGRLIQASDE
jgi:hypothetical protein